MNYTNIENIKRLVTNGMKTIKTGVKRQPNGSTIIECYGMNDYQANDFLAKVDNALQEYDDYNFTDLDDNLIESLENDGYLNEDDVIDNFKDYIKENSDDKDFVEKQIKQIEDEADKFSDVMFYQNEMNIFDYHVMNASDVYMVMEAVIDDINNIIDNSTKVHA